VPKDSGLPPNVTEFRDRHGRWHLRFRQKGRPTHYFKARPGSAAFREELERCRNALPDKRERIAERMAPGSINALISTYYGLPLFLDLADSSRRTYRNMLERFRGDFGHLKVRTLTRQAISEIIGDMSATPVGGEQPSRSSAGADATRNGSRMAPG